MKVLVTGGNGFIGKHVVRDLVSRGIEVISFDIVPASEYLKGVAYVTGTVMDEIALGLQMRDCDAVLHLAAVLGVKRADSELLRCLNINALGTLKVLEACVMNDVPYVLISSSSEIFGDISKEKLSEESPFNPKSGYAISKLAAEKYVEGFNKEYGLNYNIVRFFNIYGPGQVAEFVVPRFIKMIQNGISPKLYGDGKQVRSFCHIADATRALVDIFLNKKLRNQVFNVGNDLEPVTMLGLAEKISNIFGSDLKPTYIPFVDSDRHSGREIYYRVPDISKVRKWINYEPKVMLDEGIQNVVESKDIPESWTELAPK